jgi:uncharacterized membrane protein
MGVKAMNFSMDPLLEAPAIVQVHAFAAMAAFVLGLVQLVAPKGTLPHKTLGLLWVALMTVITVSAAFILRPAPEGTPYWDRLSFIHLFIPITAFGIVSGSLLLLRGGPALRRHSRPFISVYIGGLIIAGVLAFLPGRIMHAVVFGG